MKKSNLNFKNQKIKISVYIFTLLLSLILSSCNSYYTAERYELSKDNILNLDPYQNAIILHFQNQAWLITGIDTINFKGDYIVAKIKSNLEGHYHYKSTYVNGNNVYEPSAAVSPIGEVHLYARELRLEGEDIAYITISKLRDFQIYEKNRAATAASHIFGFFGYLILGWLGLVVLIIVLAILAGGF